MKVKSRLIGAIGAALLSLGAGATGAVISQSSTPTTQNAGDKQQGMVNTPQLSRSKQHKSRLLPGIDPLDFEPVIYPDYTSPIWYGKSQRAKHFNKKRHGRSLRRKHKRS